jgi:beta-glucosidase
VIQSGTPVSLPWDEVPAALQVWYGGNEAGHGIVDVLLGKTSLSGKLPMSWPKHIEDTPSFLSFRSEAGRCRHAEGVFVGYRYYEKTRRAVQWPFGYGLSYAAFELEHLEVSFSGSGLEGQMQVSVDVRNTSGVDGSEVCQAYVRRVSESMVSKPLKELKGFAKVFVPAGEVRVAHVTIDVKYAASVWDEAADRWLMEEGDFELLVGTSSAVTSLSWPFRVESSVHWRGC